MLCTCCIAVYTVYGNVLHNSIRPWAIEQALHICMRVCKHAATEMKEHHHLCRILHTHRRDAHRTYAICHPAMSYIISCSHIKYLQAFCAL